MMGPCNKSMMSLSSNLIMSGNHMLVIIIIIIKEILILWCKKNSLFYLFYSIFQGVE